jgi:hypothetical protein
MCGAALPPSPAASRASAASAGTAGAGRRASAPLQAGRT